MVRDGAADLGFVEGASTIRFVGHPGRRRRTGSGRQRGAEDGAEGTLAGRLKAMRWVSANADRHARHLRAAMAEPGIAHRAISTWCSNCRRTRRCAPRSRTAPAPPCCRSSWSPPRRRRAGRARLRGAEAAVFRAAPQGALADAGRARAAGAGRRQRAAPNARTKLGRRLPSGHCPASCRASTVFGHHKAEGRGWPGHKGVHAGLRRAMPSPDDDEMRVAPKATRPRIRPA